MQIALRVRVFEKAMLSTSVLSELPLADFLLSHQAVVVVAVHARRLKIVLQQA